MKKLLGQKRNPNTFEKNQLGCLIDFGGSSVINRPHTFLRKLLLLFIKHYARAL